jgi:hypothetical protein
MIRAVALIVLIACGHPLSADDSAPDSQDKTRDIAELLKRVKDLEQRVAQLEASAKQTTPIAPVPQSPQYPTPKYYPHVAPVPPSPYTPNGNPYSQPPAPNATHVPPVAPGSNVPKTWQPFHFNGQWYYIVPIDEATARIDHSTR